MKTIKLNAGIPQYTYTVEVAADSIVAMMEQPLIKVEVRPELFRKKSCNIYPPPKDYPKDGAFEKYSDAEYELKPDTFISLSNGDKHNVLHTIAEIKELIKNA